MAETYSTVALSNSVVLSNSTTIEVGGGALNGVTSCSISLEGESIDITTRSDGGWSKALPGKKSCSISLEFKRISGDAGQTNIYTAWSTSTPSSPLGVSVVISGGLASISGDFVVESLEETQDMDDSVNVSVSLRNYGAVIGGSGSGA